MKKQRWIIRGLTGIFLLLFVVLGIFTLLEYKPPEVVDMTTLERKLELKQEEFTVLIYNIGYGGLGKDADFFMDGGSSVNPPSKEVVEENLQGIAKELKENPADFYLLQEVDLSSKRSFKINEKEYLEHALGLEGHFAANYKAAYVPYPWPTLGKIHSGLLSLSPYKVQRVYRQALPVPFSWPVSTVNLKRCLLVEEVPLKDSDKNLILINLHLEAYDKGEGKALQSQVLFELAKSYYEQGHYVLAGGDWNQIFPGGERFRQQEESYWKPGHLALEDLPAKWSYLSDDSLPTCRSLHQAYSGKDHQFYLIDGFLASPNLELKSIKTLDTKFTYSDHQPVLLRMDFKE